MEGERDLLPLAICAFDFLLKNKTKKTHGKGDRSEGSIHTGEGNMIACLCLKHFLESRDP